MQNRSKENYNYQKIIAVVAISLFAIKFIAWRITGSIAIFTDAMESIVNVIGGFVGLYSLYLSSLPKDSNHPYGHGKVEFISAGIEGALITIAGGAIIYKSILALIHPSPLADLDYGIYLVLISAIVNFAIGAAAVKRGKRNNSLALIASGKHLQSDTYTTIGIVVGLVILRVTGLAWLDATTAIIFALLIIYQGVKIVRHALAGIMDEADTKLIEELVDHLNQHRHEQWVDLHNLRIVKYGAIYHIDCHLTVPWYITVKEAHKESDELENLVSEKYEGLVELSTHTEDCNIKACPICVVKDCKHRQMDYQQRIEWSAENVSSSQRHYKG